MARTAFVAHSFDKEDGQHVSAFLEFLSGISKVNPQFRWKHARDAEPRDVREKVLDISADADFFIVICSKKERVFEPGRAKSAVLSSSKLVVNANDCEWATSAWIVQEIGLAIGRHIPVILLLERGVRNPGGMQGNLEFIEFDRALPGECFVRLTEMLGNLTGEIGPSDQEAKSESKPLDHGDGVLPGTADSSSGAVSEPTDEMSLSDLREGLLRSYLRRDFTLASRFEEAFLRSQFGASEEARDEWTARKNWLSQIFAGQSDVNSVASLSRKFRENPEIGTSYARLLNALGEYGAAAKEFHRVSEIDGNDAQRIQRLCDSARALAESGESNAALMTIREAVNYLVGTADEEEERRGLIASALGNVLEPRDKFLKATLMEHVSQLNPGDTDARFQLAYLYGDIAMPAQAMHNYLRIPDQVRSDWAWNNLGVEFGNIGAKGKAVSAYIRAEREGNKLAISNRAKLLRDAGFLDEAEQALLSAIRAGAEEPALAETLASVASQRAEDDKAVEARREDARKIERISKAFGRALLTPAKFDWDGEWSSQDLTITISAIENRIEGSGSYERNRGLRRLMSGIATGDSNKEIVVVAVSCEVIASGAFGSIDRSVRGSNATLLGGSTSEKILIWFDAAEGVLHLVERKSTSDFIEHILQKVA